MMNRWLAVAGMTVLLCVATGAEELIEKSWDVSSLPDSAPLTYRIGESIEETGGEDHDSAWYRAYLADLGVTWPEGSSLTYDPWTERLYVKNTPGNLERIGEKLEKLEMASRANQIEIQVQFLEFELADIDEILRREPGTVIGLDAVRDLRGQGKGRLLCAPVVTTQSGLEATVKGVQEYIYSSEYSLETVTNGQSVTFCAIQGQFEKREVGALLTVIPELSQEDKVIRLTLGPELVGHPEWKKEQVSIAGPKQGQEVITSVRQPYFPVYSVQTTATLADGETAMIGGGMPDRTETKQVYVLVTARLVDAAGKPLKREK